MKKSIINFAILFIVSILGVTITSCEKNDNVENDEKKGEGKLIISDGLTINVNQAILQSERRTDHVYFDIIFSDGDILSLPDKILNKIQLKIYSEEMFFPEGEVKYTDKWNEIPTFWYSFTANDVNPHEEYLSDEDIDTGTYYYSINGEQGNMTISTTSKGYLIKIDNLKFKKSPDGTNTTTKDDPEVTASFVYEGDIENVNKWKPAEQDD